MGRMLGYIPTTAVIICLAATAAQAALLNLTKTTPDITAASVNVNYVAATSMFTATGFSSAYDLDGISPPDFSISAGGVPSQQFLISMTVNNATGALVSGTVAVNGTIPALGANSGSLLTGTLTNFGFMNPPGGTLFEFLFNVTGGDLLPAFGPLHTGGIILNATQNGGTPFTGVFTSNFFNTASTAPALGTADAFFVPEPGSLSLLTISGFAAVGARWRRCGRLPR